MSEPNPTRAFRLGRGSVVAGYELLDCLGRGWESTSYLAAEQHSGAIRRMKFFRIDEPEEIELVRHTAATFERLRSTGAVPAYHHMGIWPRNHHERIPYLVLGYIDGKPLNRVLDDGRWHRRWTAVEALTVLVAIARKLAAVHKLGCGVGDFSDGNNILITQCGDAFWCDLEPGLPDAPNRDRANDRDEFFTILDRMAELRPVSPLMARAEKRLARFRDAPFRPSTLQDIAQRLDALLDGLHS